MELSVLLTKTILSMFLMSIMGYILVKVKILKGTDSKSLSAISVYICCPCVAITAFQVEYNPDKMKGLLIAIFVVLVIHVILLVVTKISDRFLHFDSIEKVSIIYSNSGNLTIPLVYAVLGKEWVLYTSAYTLVQTAFMWTHGEATICNRKGINLKKIFANINVIAIICGTCIIISEY